jgi:glycerol-3-phosphate O-acyltransferase
MKAHISTPHKRMTEADLLKELDRLEKLLASKNMAVDQTHKLASVRSALAQIAALRTPPTTE